MTARAADINGYIDIPGNPISKIGVYPYSGRQLGLFEPGDPRNDQIFQVYRSADELFAPETIESFKLLPFVDEHAMLGSEDIGATPAERKGVQGMIGEQVYADPPYLRGNLRILSESMKSLIGSGKQELSPGYRCRYRLTPGQFEGQNYDAEQYMIRGNHLALVNEGRTGADVSVLDDFRFTIDAKELAAMADENTQGGSDLEQIKALIDQLKPLLEKQAEAQALLAEAGLIPKVDAPVIDEDPKPSQEPPAMTDETVTEEKVVELMDKAMDEKLKPIKAAIDSLTKNSTAMDSKLIIGIAERDALAGRLSQFVGTFDHAKMTGEQVAKYGVEKLGLTCSEGQEVAALDAYMKDRVPDHRSKLITAEDSKDFDLMGSYAAQEKK
jgi:hypothetical protein